MKFSKFACIAAIAPQSVATKTVSIIKKGLQEDSSLNVDDITKRLFSGDGHHHQQAPPPSHTVDAGLLNKGGGYGGDEEDKRRRLAANTGDSSCPTEYVTCKDGFATFVGNVTVGPNVTCQDACGGECCVGEGGYSAFNSCTGFTGRVCKDGVSCSDSTSGVFDPFASGRACYYAEIGTVVNGCNGQQACDRAGRGGHLGRVVNSCYGGDVMEDSFPSPAFFCSSAASDNGHIKEIVDSCKGGFGACYRTAANGGNISSIRESCVGVRSCEGAAYGGSIGYINHGCRGVTACFYAAYDRSIGGISYACNNISSCESLADGFDGYDRVGYDSINSTIVSCCNEESECTGSIVDALGLPDQCNGFVGNPRPPHCDSDGCSDSQP